MKQNYFTNTIQSSFIKNLLFETYLPICNTVRDGDYIINGVSYLYGCSLINCTASGIIGEDAKFEVINDKFYLGYNYPGYTSNYISKNAYYSSDDHKRLGDYLRCFRDIWKTDLMPFYNCFTGVYTSRFYLRDKVYEYKYDYYNNDDKSFSKKYYSNVDFKVLQIPVKFNKKYTIAIDCDSIVSVGLAIIDNNELLSVKYNGNVINLQSLVYSNVMNVSSYNGVSFKQPIVIETTNKNKSLLYSNNFISIEKFLSLYEHDLYLLIQIPQSNSSSVVVLEGDYSTTSGTTFFNKENPENIFNINNADLDKAFISNLSLLQFSNGIRYPFADRLIEFLLWHAISNNDLLKNNVSMYQKLFDTAKRINSDGFTLNKYTIDGAWDCNIRDRVYNASMNNNIISKVDLTGYIDKDVEYAFNRKGD